MSQSCKPDEGNTDAWRALGCLSALASLDRVWNVFLISDGHITNKAATYVTAKTTKNNCRIFTFGVRYVWSGLVWDW